MQQQIPGKFGFVQYRVSEASLTQPFSSLETDRLQWCPRVSPRSEPSPSGLSLNGTLEIPRL